MACAGGGVRRSAPGGEAGGAAGCGEPATVVAAELVGEPEPQLVRRPVPPSVAAAARVRRAAERASTAPTSQAAPPAGTRDRRSGTAPGTAGWSCAPGARGCWRPVRAGSGTRSSRRPRTTGRRCGDEPTWATTACRTRIGRGARAGAALSGAPPRGRARDFPARKVCAMLATSSSYWQEGRAISCPLVLMAANHSPWSCPRPGQRARWPAWSRFVPGCGVDGHRVGSRCWRACSSARTWRRLPLRERYRSLRCREHCSPGP